MKQVATLIITVIITVIILEVVHWWVPRTMTDDAIAAVSWPMSPAWVEKYGRSNDSQIAYDLTLLRHNVTQNQIILNKLIKHTGLKVQEPNAPD